MAVGNKWKDEIGEEKKTVFQLPEKEPQCW